MIIFNNILLFWFGSKTDDAEVAKEKQKLWWSKNPLTDEEIKESFEGHFEAFLRGELEEWKKTTNGTLALILLTDQFPRNIYRDTPKAFGFDGEALKLSKGLTASGDDMKLRPVERIFAYMPLEHSESKEDQEESIKRFTCLIDGLPEAQRETFLGFLNFAVRHKEIIDRFGRFPHRNKILGRKSTPEEIEFLKEPGSSF